LQTARNGRYAMARMPRRPFHTPANLLDYEIVQEQVSALGRMGRRLEQALARLRAFDAAHADAALAPADKRARAALVGEAGYALWMFVVQREACGLRDSRAVMRDYNVPREVHLRMGAFPNRWPYDARPQACASATATAVMLTIPRAVTEGVST
jgi:hypothetical protein